MVRRLTLRGRLRRAVDAARRDGPSPPAFTGQVTDPRVASERFLDQAVLVTGAAGLIGSCLVQGFLAAGASVHAVDIDARGLDRLRSDAEVEASGRLRTHTVDLADLDATVDLAREIDRLDVLVNNVGYNDFVLGAEGLTAEAWRRILDINLVGPAMLTGELIPRLAATGRGSVVFITSTNAIHPSPWLPYGAAKAALAKVVVDLAHQLAPRHVRVNAVAPGWVQPAYAPGDRQVEAVASIPSGGVPTEAIVNAVLFLSDSGSSPATTGQQVVIDGAARRSRDRLFDPPRADDSPT